MKKDYAIIFRRGKDTEKGRLLEPLEYIEGEEKSVRGKQCFVINPDYKKRLLEETKSDKELSKFLEEHTKLKFSEDASCFDEEFVYGSPLCSSTLKDALVYNFGFLEDVYQVGISESTYENNVNRLKQSYVEALKKYTFYQNTEDGKVETKCERKTPQIITTDLSKIIMEMLQGELGLGLPEDYDPEEDLEDFYKELPKGIDIKKIYEQCKKYIIGQDEHILPILSAINDNLNADVPEEKTNILVCGSTGCGKTAIFKRIAEMVGLPIIIENATQFTKAGYVGRNIDDIFEDLVEEAEGDRELAERGIIIIDEIDKKASGKDDTVSGVGVIHSLLKLLEGGDYTYEFGKGMTTELRTFNTLKTTIAFSGAFSDLSQLVNKKRSIGFSDQQSMIDKQGIDLYDVESLAKYGIPPEFIGRINLIEVINDLTEEDLKNILKNAKINPYDLFIKKMKKHNTRVITQDEFIDAVAREAYRKKTGARGLYTVMKQATKRAQGEIELLPRNTQKELILTPDCVYDNSAYQLNTQVKKRVLKR